MGNARSRHGLLIVAAVIALALAPASAARCESFALTAARFISLLAEKAIEPLTTAAAADPSDRVRALLDNFDFAGFGQIALGPYWASANGVQKAEFARLLSTSLERSYGGYLTAYAGGSLEVIGSRDLAGGNALVVSRLVDGAGGNPLRIDWFVRDTAAGSPKIGDVIVAGVSMARTDADEFGSAIRLAGLGLDGLLRQLREKYLVTGTVAAAAN
jgi:phospholipid transport system substrate-binding protein